MNLFIGNLNPQTSEESLRTLFSEFGSIVSIKIPVDTETGLPRGFGFVEMSDKFEGYDAIDNIDGTYFEGQVISVKESKPKNGGGGNRRGFNNKVGGFKRSGGGGNGRGFGNNNYGNGGGYGNRNSGYRSNDNRDRDSDDPNRQPGRRFSPRGPRPGSDN